jgi:hypothetical protein
MSAETSFRGRSKRSLKARSRSVYDNEVHGRGDSRIPRDDLTINERLCAVTMIRPNFDKGPLYFRPWPALSYEDPQNTLSPGRIGLAPRAQSHWIVRMPAAKYVGLNDPSCDRSTFLLYRPGDKEAKNNNPFRILSYGAKDAHDAGKFGSGRAWNSEWNRLLQGSKGKGAELGRPTALWFVQGAVYANGDKDYLESRSEPYGSGPKDDLVVLQLPTSAGGALMDLLDIEKKKTPAGAEENPSLAFYYGDAVGRFDPEKFTCGPGLVIVVFNPKKTRITEDSSFDGKLKDVQGYEVAIQPDYVDSNDDIYNPELSGQALQTVFDHWQFWEDDPDSGEQGLLRFPCIEEQCLLIAKGFRPVSQLLHFAWADHPEFFTDEVNSVIRARRAVVMPGDPEEADEDDEAQNEEAYEAGRRQPRRTDVAVSGARRRFGEDDEADEAPSRSPAGDGRVEKVLAAARKLNAQTPAAVEPEEEEPAFGSTRAKARKPDTKARRPNRFNVEEEEEAPAPVVTPAADQAEETPEGEEDAESELSAEAGVDDEPGDEDVTEDDDTLRARMTGARKVEGDKPVVVAVTETAPDGSTGDSEANMRAALKAARDNSATRRNSRRQPPPPPDQTDGED